MIEIDRFHAILAQPEARGYDLNAEQKQAVNHGEGPLWLIAGPGSGKTEVLVTRALKLMCVDSVKPRAIFMTTFTKKAARNMEDRLASYLIVLQQAEPILVEVDLADLRIGTIHSLCNDVLQEYRAPNYQNVRLLDDVDQNLFAYRYAEIAECQDLGFWAHFDYCLSRWKASNGYAPNKWARVRAANTLFNHIVEDYVDVHKMAQTGEHWATLAEFYQQYEQTLRSQYRCDFAHLQARFLRFLTQPVSRRFLLGDEDAHPSLAYILVDEYQDTNPIQERIYLALAQHHNHNITVVGDDDQALYRFRGGTVACMVNFDQACQHAFGTSPTRIQLDKNYRSHNQIVEFFNEYINSFEEMKVTGVRAPNKGAMLAESAITTDNPDYDSVAWITSKKAGDLPTALARFVKEVLKKDGIIEDWSQCVLLLRSTRDSPRNAGPFLRAFQELGIPVYNPRSKSFMDSEEVQCLLAALIQVIDLSFTWASNRGRGVSQTIQSWIDKLIEVHENPNIPTEAMYLYVERSMETLPKECSKNKDTFLNITLMDIIYRLLSCEPFSVWQKEPERNLRLSKVTRLFESYHSLNLDTLIANESGTELSPIFLNRFYYMFINYLLEAGINDDEDEEMIVPEGYFPFMTIHQAKGLEFPFVFVGQLGRKGPVGATQILEHELTPFRQDLYPRHIRPPQQLALEDDVRLLYVAYSRAQYGLVLVGIQSQLKKHVTVPGRDFHEFRRYTPIIGVE